MRRLAVVVGLASMMSGCAAESRPPASSAPAAPAAYGQPGAYPQQQPGYPSSTPQPGQAPPPPEPASPSTPKAPAPTGGANSGAPDSRSMALQSAASEVESSQRELDVAAGDCRNACRALGSMDRAAGKVCELAQGEGEGRRCDDAKKRVYSARDRVKSTCGKCDGGPSVERTAPIPSLR